MAVSVAAMQTGHLGRLENLESGLRALRQRMQWARKVIEMECVGHVAASKQRVQIASTARSVRDEAQLAIADLSSIIAWHHRHQIEQAEREQAAAAAETEAAPPPETALPGLGGLSLRDLLLGLIVGAGGSYLLRDVLGSKDSDSADSQESSPARRPAPKRKAKGAKGKTKMLV